jgi:TPR repeat protein
MLGTQHATVELQDLAVECLGLGGGLPKDDSQAVSWFRKSAEAGDATGMANLGVMYVSGRGGLPKDDGQAVSWFRKRPRLVMSTACISWASCTSMGGAVCRKTIAKQ